MATPTGPLWEADGHTLAKHALLRGYLEAWLPVMGRSSSARVLVIDGFAGPGRYTGGEPGSPLVILDTFLSHRDRAAWDSTEFVFAFIEQDRRRFDHLATELGRIGLPANAKVLPILGAFDTEMSKLLDSIPAGATLAPAFVFVDPFGWTEHGLELSSRILGFAKCEVLVYVPLPFIARFVSQEGVADSLDNLFGDDSWLPARDIDDGLLRAQFLHDRFLAKLRDAAGYARSFEIGTAGRGWTGYHLFFGSGSPTGLSKMKYAMWRLDPETGARFQDSTDRDQMALFEPEPDLRPLAEALRREFGTRTFTIEQAQQFTLLQTPFHPAIHLKRAVLRPAECNGELEAWDRRRANTYPAGAKLRFTPR